MHIPRSAELKLLLHDEFLFIKIIVLKRDLIVTIIVTNWVQANFLATILTGLITMLLLFIY